MSNTLNIQKAVDSDLDGIEEIYNESIDWLNSRDIHQWKRGVYPTRNSAIDAFEKECLYSCYIEKDIVATFIINEIQPSQYANLKWKYNDGKALVIHTLVVRPSQTGKGISKSIMKFVIEYAKINNYLCIRLDAFPDNKWAVNLYKSFGFVYVGEVFFDIKEPSYEWYDCYEKKL